MRRRLFLIASNSANVVVGSSSICQRSIHVKTHIDLLLLLMFHAIIVLIVVMVVLVLLMLVLLGDQASAAR
jgi:hypothetical protein